ncbi:hypothetical protein C8R45DRAFT_179888 [Mycena sanguinolenta]|nr:hypothetical protein C8R45DRAFT_179888 [Mycena sanguinolenta]
MCENMKLATARRQRIIFIRISCTEGLSDFCPMFFLPLWPFASYASLNSKGLRVQPRLGRHHALPGRRPVSSSHTPRWRSTGSEGRAGSGTRRREGAVACAQQNHTNKSQRNLVLAGYGFRATVKHLSYLSSTSRCRTGPRSSRPSCSSRLIKAMPFEDHHARDLAEDVGAVNATLLHASTRCHLGLQPPRRARTPTSNASARLPRPYHTVVDTVTVARGTLANPNVWERMMVWQVVAAKFITRYVVYMAANMRGRSTRTWPEEPRLMSIGWYTKPILLATVLARTHRPRLRVQTLSECGWISLLSGFGGVEGLMAHAARPS